MIMPLPDTGRYTIINVQFLNFAVLPDADDRSDIVAGTQPEHDGEKWNITLLNNGKYTIKNHGFSSEASCEYRPAQEANLVGGRCTGKQWIIKETRTKDQFTISPTDADLFWGLTDGEMKTPIVLRETATDRKNHWTLVPDKETSAEGTTYVRSSVEGEGRSPPTPSSKKEKELDSKPLSTNPPSRPPPYPLPAFKGKVFGGEAFGGNVFPNEAFGGRAFGGEAFGGNVFPNEAFRGKVFANKAFRGSALGGETLGGRVFANEAFGGKAFPNEPFGGKDFANEAFGGKFGGKAFANEPFGGKDFANEPFGGKDFTNEVFGGRAFGGEAFANDAFGGEAFANDAFGGEHTSAHSPPITRPPLFTSRTWISYEGW
ncbi:hypothetical protein MVEN_00105100 [Mycena venus]|uniref:Ricin B lectin domain-containing protein n=1 Tax=Mycena venus TaxID=2733690 RepID=A0A8H6Z4J6_9AGAR|nr:hypothetical protein MVEN_00105100 [Mycena venus]